MAQGDDVVSEIAIDHGRIVAVGSAGEVSGQLRTRCDRVVDMGGATVLPGFVDSHLHVYGVGERRQAFDVSDARTMDELLERLRAYVEHVPEDAWVVGYQWDDQMYGDHRLSLSVLDAVTKGRPTLLMRVCTHVAVANTSALRAAGIGEFAKDPADGTFGRTTEGMLDGYLYEGAVSAIVRAIPAKSLREQRAMLASGMAAALAAGITAVHTDDVRHIGSVGRTMDLYEELQRAGNQLRVHQLVGYDYLGEYVAWRTARAAGPYDADWLDAGAVKLFADGSLGGRTALLAAPYHDDSTTCGMRIDSPAVLRDKVAAVRRHGLPVAIHCIGDEALSLVLDTLSAFGPASGPDRIVHAEIVSEHLLRRMATLSSRTIVDVQPRFTVSDFPWALERLGEERARWVCAWRSMQEAGLRICGGSDAPVEPIAPLLGIHAAITRRKPGATGEGYYLQESLTPLEAVRLFTHDPSYAVGQETRKGCLAAGWLADFTVLDTDILSQDNADRIPTAKVLQTIVGGQLAYEG